MESDFANIEEDHCGKTTSGNDGGSSLAQHPLVSDDSGSSNLPTPDSSAQRYTNNFSNDPSSPSTSELETLRMEIISHNIYRLGLSPRASQDLLQRYLEPSATNRCYKKHQLRFISFALVHQLSLGEFTPQDVINFLADMRASKQHQVSTLKISRSTIAHLHREPQSISTSVLLNSYLDSLICQDPPTLIHKPTLVMAPALRFAQYCFIVDHTF